MKEMAVYLVLVIIGAAIMAGLGLALDEITPQLSMPIFLGLFFLNFWTSWRLALWLTEPKVPKVG